MAYFLVTGDEQADPEKLRRLLDEKIAARPVDARESIRLEAEHFCELNGFEIEDRNDRAASHRLAVKSTGLSPASIQTSYDEPYAPADGRFDVTVRFHVQASEGRLAFLVNGIEAVSQAQPVKGEQDWQSQVVRDVAIATGDTFTAITPDPQIRIDYVQLDRR